MEEFFLKNINKLSKKCKNKKVVFYCIGDIFDKITSSCNLDDYFNIIGLSDIKFNQDDQQKIKGYNCFKPNELKNINFDILIIISINFKQKEKFIKENRLINKKVKIENFFQIKENIEKRTFENYKNTLKNIKSKTQLKVLFICEENEKWCYSDLYKNLEKNSKFDVLPVCLFPINSKGKIIFTQEKNKEFFNNLNIKTCDCWNHETNQAMNIRDFNPDIVFYQQPWYLNNINHPKYVSKYALTIMSPYGYTTLNSKDWGSEFVKDIYKNLWLFIAESPYHTKFYKQTAKMKNNVIPFGSLKLDNYQKPVQKNHWKKPENFKIIYAPHHSIANDGLKMSTFAQNYNDFLNFAQNNKNYSFIFKPHPMLENSVCEYNLMTKEEYQNYLSEWKNLNNANVYDKGEYFDVFKTSDLLITDCSSFLAEYYPSKKPIIFLNRKDRAPFDAFGNIIKKGFYIANNFQEVEELLANIAQNKNDDLKKTREKILQKHFYMKNTTYKKITEFLCSLIN